MNRKIIFKKCVILGLAFLISATIHGTGSFANDGDGSPAPDPVSSEMSLDGSDWQYKKVTDAILGGSAPVDSGWTTTTVPGYLYGWKYERAWFKKIFYVTAEKKTSVMKLRFNSIKYNSKVYLNGQLVGGNLGGYEPFEVDVSEYIVEGQNTLYVGVYDWTGTFTEPAFSESPVNLSATTDTGAQKNSGTFDTVISAIGNFYYYYGIWDSVYLLSRPEVNIEDVFVKTYLSTSETDNQIKLDVTLSNTNPYTQSITVRNSILDPGNNIVKVLPETSPFDIETLLPKNITVAADWPDPILWSPATPYLYRVKTEIVHAPTGRILDEKITRFGFREFKYEGIYFYLNGIKTKLMGTSNPPPTKYMSEDAIRTVLINVKNGNNNVFRLHSQPWPELWYKVADELGLLIIEESAYFGNAWQNNKYSDPVFWDNFRIHLERMIKKGRNHPSIIMWSLENELQHIGNNHESITDELASLVSHAKQIDDTRPIYFEADLDPGSQADVIGIHYPHEYPENYAYPNTANWSVVNRPFMYINGFHWDKTKPLYIGEFGWVNTWLPDAFAIMYGDKAYCDPAYYRGNTFIWGYYKNNARARIWEQQIQAYRENEVSGIAPWNIFDDASIETRDELDLNLANNILYATQKRAFEPVRFFVKNFDKNFFASKEVIRAIVVHNDAPEASSLRLEWNTGHETGSESYTLDPAALEERSIRFTTPDVTEKTALTLNLKLYRNGILVFEENEQYNIYPQPNSTIEPGKRIGLYDINGSTETMLDTIGISYTAINDINNIPRDLDLLIIGARVFTGTEDLGILNDLVEKGMNVLILEQDSYPASSLNIQMKDAPATWVFKRATTGALFDGITDEDLMYWSGDHYVLRKNILNPSSGNYRTLADSGNFDKSIYSPVGLNYSPIIEILRNRGKYILSQLLIVEKYENEPTAKLLLNNLIRYALAEKAPYSMTAFFGNNTAVTQFLQNKGFNYSNIPSLDNLDNYRLLIISGDDATWNSVSTNAANINQFVNNGGRLLLHLLNNANYEKLRAAGILDIPYEMKDTTLYPILKNTADEFTSGLSNYDLNWLNNYQLKQNIANSFLFRNCDLPIDPAPAEIKATAFLINTYPKTGKPNPADPDKWLLFSNGYIEEPAVPFGNNPSNTLTIVAAGTQAGGIYPIMAVKIDGIEAYRFSVNNASYRDYTFSGIPPGDHSVRIELVNYAYIAPDYRRLIIDKIRYGASSDNGSVVELTRPAALVKINKGNGQIVIDNIKWDTETNDPKRALRYVSNILTNLGGRFGAPFADFNAAPISGNAPLAVHFADTSTNNTTGWSWSFGDGQTSGEQNPVHTYDTEGTYTVSLTAVNNIGSDIEEKTGYIIVTTPPPTQYSITASAGSGGTITPSGVVAIDYGADKVFTITSEANYHIVDVLVDGVSVGNVSSYTFNSIKGNHTIEALFAIDTHSLTLTSEHGSISKSPDKTSYDHGESVTLTATPVTGYTFTGWTGDLAGATNPVAITMDSSKSVTALFTSNVYTIIAIAGSNGMIVPSGAITVDRGSSQTFTITPSTGYRISDVLVNGISVGAVKAYTFRNISANNKIAASFTRNKHKIAVTASGKGTIFPTEALDMDGGSNQTFTIIPNIGSHIKDVIIDGVSRGPIENYAFTGIEASHTINAIFESDVSTVSDSISHAATPAETLTGATQTNNIDYAGNIIVWPEDVPATDNAPKTLKSIDTPSEKKPSDSIITEHNSGASEPESNSAKDYSDTEGYRDPESRQDTSLVLLKLVGDMVVESSKKLQFSVRPIDTKGDNISYNIDKKIAGLSFEHKTGMLEWTPTEKQRGKFKLTFTATDNEGNSSHETITIKVSGPRSTKE